MTRQDKLYPKMEKENNRKRKYCDNNGIKNNSDTKKMDINETHQKENK